MMMMIGKTRLKVEKKLVYKFKIIKVPLITGI